jgi:hypothetical protein
MDLFGMSLNGPMASGVMPRIPLHTELFGESLGTLDQWRLELAGEPFGGIGAEPWSGVNLFTQGDMEFFVRDIGLADYAAHNPCSWCLGNTTNIPWNHFSTLAGWCLTCHTNDEFMLRFRGCTHPVWGWPGVGRHTFRLDTLHINDHHGVSSKAIGSFFYEIVCDGELPGSANKELNMRILTQRIHIFQAANGTRNKCPKLFLKNLINIEDESNSFPELHGPVIKAATTKDLIPFCSYLADQLDDGTPYKSRRAKVFQCLLAFNNIIDNSGEFLTDDQKLQLSKSIYGVLINYSWLAKNAVSRGLLRWHITPKFHYFAHLIVQADVINPRFTRCYTEESMVGRVAKMFRTSAKGPFQNSIQATVLAKYILGLNFRFG